MTRPARRPRKGRKRKSPPAPWPPLGKGLPDMATLEALSQATEPEPDNGPMWTKARLQAERDARKAKRVRSCPDVP